MAGIYRSVQRAPREDRRFGSARAALALRKLADLDERITRRRTMADRLKSLLPGSVKPQSLVDCANPNYYFFIATVPDPPDALRRHLLRHGFDAGIREEIADDCASFLGYGDCPNARAVHSQAIHLPLHEGMSDAVIERLADLLRARYA